MYNIIDAPPLRLLGNCFYPGTSVSLVACHRVKHMFGCNSRRDRNEIARTFLINLVICTCLNLATPNWHNGVVYLVAS